MDQAGSISSRMAWRAPGVLPTRNCPAMEFFTSHTGHEPAFPWPKSSSSGGFFPPFPHLLSEPWVWIQAGILQDAPEGRWKDFPALINPRGSRTGWFQAQPKVPSSIPCVHQEGLIHGLICDPCDCPQKTLRASCVIVPSEVPMATSAQKSTSFGGTGKTPWIPSGQGKGSLMEQPQCWVQP